MSPFLTSALFGLVALVAVVCSILVVTRRNPIYSALFLVVVFAAVAVDFFLLGAQFLGFMQLLVYAGAIMVVYLFVIMLINPREDRLPDEGGPADRMVAGGVSALIFSLLYMAIRESARVQEIGSFNTLPPLPATKIGADLVEHGTARAFGWELFTNHLLAFELTSVLVMVAIIGAVHLSLRPRRQSMASPEDSAHQVDSPPASPSTAAVEREEPAGV